MPASVRSGVAEEVGGADVTVNALFLFAFWQMCRRATRAGSPTLCGPDAPHAIIDHTIQPLLTLMQMSQDFCFSPLAERREARYMARQRALRLSVRTTAFHVVKAGSIPAGRATFFFSQ
jgi:hypothetical protein